MPYTMEDFEKNFTREHLHLLLPEERLKGLPAETILKQFSLEERLKGISPEVIKAYLSKLNQTD